MNKWELLLPLSKSLKHVFFLILPSRVRCGWIVPNTYFGDFGGIFPLVTRAIERVTKKK